MLFGYQTIIQDKEYRVGCTREEGIKLINTCLKRERNGYEASPSVMDQIIKISEAWDIDTDELDDPYEQPVWSDQVTYD